MQHQPPHLSPIPLSARYFWLNPLACAATGAVISIFFQKSYGSCGDYPQHFHACWWGLGIGAAAGLALNFLHEKIPGAWRAQPLAIGFLRFFLAYIMLSYGVAKIVPTQFPHLLANLDNTFNELTPMRVAWTFFGYSKGYQMLMGWAETIPALLLFFRRTWLLGALLMATVLVNVVAVNFFFKVCVKLNSSIYLGIALFLLLTEFGRLRTFFFTENAVPPPVRRTLFQSPKTRRIARILNGLLVTVILGNAGYSALTGLEYLRQQESVTPVSGIWQVEKMERLRDGAWMEVPAADSLRLNRLYFQGIFGIFKGPARRDRTTIEVDSVQKEIRVTFITPRNERPVRHSWQYRQSDASHLHLSGRLWDDSIRIDCISRKEIK